MSAKLKSRRNRNVVLSALTLVMFMGVMSFQAGPAYRWLLDIAGINISPQLMAKPDEKVLERRMKIRFDTSIGRDLPWVFKPAKREINLQIGATGLAFYEIYNPTDQTLAGIARTATAPHAAEYYLTTIDTFDGEVQVLKPGERKLLPVSFYVNPEIKDDREAWLVPAITLSFTFYLIELPQDEVSLVQTNKNPLN